MAKKERCFIITCPDWYRDFNQQIARVSRVM